MHIRNFFNHSIDEQYQLEFLRETTLLNIKRGRILASVVLLIEITLLLVNLSFINQPIRVRYDFAYFDYGVMYMLMIEATLVYLYLSSCAYKRIQQGLNQFTDIQALMVIYITFIMSWSAVISLFDQRLYGSVTAFLTTLVLIPFIFYLKTSLQSIPYLVSLTIFIVGVPYYQSSLTVLIGHGINVGIFVILSWLMARILYSGYMKDFISRREIDRKNQLLNDINQRLNDEIMLRKEIQEDLERANRELKELSLIDDLTGIPNRRSLDNFLNTEWKRAIREVNSVSLLMIDIDFFKLFNDNYGHLAGDDCLIRVAQALQGNCRRPSDFVARLGGEEFLFVAINIDEAGTKRLAENIKESVQRLNIQHEYSKAAPNVTISVGIAVLEPSISDTPADAIKKADLSLYSAKLAGRNRVGA